ncbi:MULTISPECIES: DUF2683 family protein [Chryseobacterium]|jgi:hypothetical protein|uniref:Uncharacterized protein n=3 Tax=Chryseobacterium TaxID=59732 RepID=A0ABR8ZDE6_9FLAO|nr:MULTISPECIES: DUF2683 family protein [Chryseobacterium]MBD8082915.1 hypothetical protein [Chryseobacterium caseinilyticum]MCX8522522.1 hypothetical protein [Chryseobacterium formosus]MCX8533440.1 hypothetical protein [Chryseobacterium luquanense]
MEVVLKNLKKKDFEVIKSLAKALGFEIEKKEEQSPYNPEFVKKILDAQKEIEEGKGTKMTLEELDALWK